MHFLSKLLSSFGLQLTCSQSGILIKVLSKTDSNSVDLVELKQTRVVRRVIEAGHRWVGAAWGLGGATLLVVAVGLARIVVVPAELPTGVLTALLGAPFFVALLLQQRKDV